MLLAVGDGWTMLRGGGGLTSQRSHLKLANLALGKAAIVVVARALLLRFRLRELLLRWVRLMAHRGTRLRVLAREVDAGGCRGYLGLILEQTGLKIDDVVAELVVFLLQSSVMLNKRLVLFDLILELFDVLFFTLAKGSLHNDISMGVQGEQLGDALGQHDSEQHASTAKAPSAPCVLRWSGRRRCRFGSWRIGCQQ